MIKCENLGKVFNEVDVLKDISFCIGNGERVSLVGPGGCGKTTILKCLLGVVNRDRGIATINDQDLSRISQRQKRALLRKVGMAFQQGGLFDFMSVRQNIYFAMENMTNFDEQKKNDKLKLLLSLVKLSRAENMFPHELSGGMQRRIGIARALCTEPEIAIFDEPTAGLDPVTSSIILNMISELGDLSQKASLLVVTSNVEIAIRFAERIIVIYNGRVEADGDWKSLLLHGSEWVKHFLSVRLIGLSIEYARGLHLPEEFIQKHWH